jgi:hypothetical protein
MFKIILFNIILLLFCFNSFAAVPAFTDTTIKLKTKEAFLQKYGIDDTARLIIDFYFMQRKRHFKSAKVAFGVLSGTALLAAGSTVVFPKLQMTLELLALFTLLILGSLLWLFIALMSRWDYSNKYLRRTLKKYQLTKQIPKRLQNNYRWKLFLRAHSIK